MDKTTEKVLLIYELNRLHQECMVKAQHLANVRSGEVPVTFDVIDICDQAFRQLTLLAPIFMKIASEVNYRDYCDELARIEVLKERVARYQSEAYAHWTAIRSWDSRNNFRKHRL